MKKYFCLLIWSKLWPKLLPSPGTSLHWAVTCIKDARNNTDLGGSITVQHSSGLSDCCPPNSASESNHSKLETSALPSGVWGLQDPVCAGCSSSTELGWELWLSDMNAAVGWQIIAPYLPLQEICRAFNFFPSFTKGSPSPFPPLTSPQPLLFKVHLLFSTSSFPTSPMTMLLTSPGWYIFKAYFVPSIPVSTCGWNLKSCPPQGHGVKS